MFQPGSLDGLHTPVALVQDAAQNPLKVAVLRFQEEGEAALAQGPVVQQLPGGEVVVQQRQVRHGVLCRFTQQLRPQGQPPHHLSCGGAATVRMHSLMTASC